MVKNGSFRLKIVIVAQEVIRLSNTISRRVTKDDGFSNSTSLPYEMVNNVACGLMKLVLVRLLEVIKHQFSSLKGADINRRNLFFI